LRDNAFKDGFFDEVVCISTLDHIGLDNTRIGYTHNTAFKEYHTDSYLTAASELARVLKPGGQALITVPYGKAMIFNWMQQFDLSGIQAIESAFQPRQSEITYFLYTQSGWQRSSAEEAAHAEYYNIHDAPGFDPDYAAAARAVACLRFIN
jgi:hypothetical protein